MIYCYNCDGRKAVDEHLRFELIGYGRIVISLRHAAWSLILNIDKFTLYLKGND